MNVRTLPPGAAELISPIHVINSGRNGGGVGLEVLPPSVQESMATGHLGLAAESTFPSNR